MTTIPHFTTLGAGPTILMLHGIGGGHLMFAPQVETFASLGYRAVAWDMPGYGRSAPIEPYTFKGLAQSCVALIDALLGEDHERRRAAPRREGPPGGQRSTQGDKRGGVVLLGHGMGGMVAQEVVARRPELVSRLILCGTTAAFGQGDGDWQRSFLAQHTAPLDAGQTMAELAQTLVPKIIGPAALPEGVKLATQCMGQVNPSTYRRALQALLSFDRQASLPNIHVPTLLVAGEHDTEAPAVLMQRMARLIAGSSYIEFSGIGHLQNLEAPEEFDGAVLAFLAQQRQLH